MRTDLHEHSVLTPAPPRAAQRTGGVTAPVNGSMDSSPPRGAAGVAGTASAAARSVARCARSTSSGCTPRWKHAAARNAGGSAASAGRSVAGACGVRHTCLAARTRLVSGVDACRVRAGARAGASSRLRAPPVQLQHLPSARRGRVRQDRQPGCVHAGRSEPRRARCRQVRAHARRQALRGWSQRNGRADTAAGGGNEGRHAPRAARCCADAARSMSAARHRPAQPWRLCRPGKRCRRR